MIDLQNSERREGGKVLWLRNHRYIAVIGVFELGSLKIRVGGFRCMPGQKVPICNLDLHWVGSSGKGWNETVHLDGTLSTSVW
jgi:hypothetical protein